MASTNTPRLNLFKPTPGTAEPFRVSDVNDNFDKIDLYATAQDGVNTDFDTRIYNNAIAISDLEGVEEGLNDRLLSAESDILGLDNRVGLLEGQNLNTRINALDAEQDVQDGRLDVIEGVNTTQAGQISALSAENSAQNILITGLQDADIALDGRLDTLEGQNLNSRLTTAEGNISSLQSADVALDGRLDTIEGQNLDTRLGTLEGQNLNTRLSALEGTIDGGTP